MLEAERRGGIQHETKKEAAIDLIVPGTGGDHDTNDDDTFFSGQLHEYHGKRRRYVVGMP